eukprot:GILJ01012592.1.p1 GENE.GILJ01012592.1~~GILJ01012592.1.p1  ORF type:complete len:467 (+),score=60.08 GILJ01012592.1:35-1435(+)
MALWSRLHSSCLSPQFHPSFQSFVTWLNRNDVGLHKLLAFEHFPSMGLGVTAAEEIRSNDVILEVPSKLWFTSARSQDEAMRNALPWYQSVKASVSSFSDPSQSDRFMRPILSSMNMRIHLSNPSSLFFPYLYTLPRELHVPLFWREAEIQSLRGSPIIKDIAEQKEFAKTCHQIALAGAPSSFFPLALFYWTMGTLFTRAHSGAKLEGLNLIPFIDCFNHSLHPNCTHDVVSIDGQQYYQIRAVSDISKGSQLFISYGSLPNSKYLRLYGFALPDNPFDASEFDVSLPSLASHSVSSAQAPQFTEALLILKQEVFKQMQWSDTQSKMVLTADGMPSDLLSQLRLIFIDSSDLSSHNPSVQLASPLNANAPQQLIQMLPTLARSPLSTDNERRVQQNVVQICDQLLSGYDTSLEEDERLLREADALQGNQRVRSAVIARKAEKQKLHRLKTEALKVLAIVDRPVVL